MHEVEEIFEMPVMDAVAEMPAAEVQEDTFSFELPNFEPAEVEAPALATVEAGQGEVASEYGALSFTDDINDLDFAGDTPTFEAAAPSFRENTQDFDALLRDIGNAPSEALTAVDMPVELPPCASSRRRKPCRAWTSTSRSKHRRRRRRRRNARRPRASRTCRSKI